jgi:hypothetical protein
MVVDLRKWTPGKSLLAHVPPSIRTLPLDPETAPTVASISLNFALIQWPWGFSPFQPMTLVRTKRPFDHAYFVF